MARSGVTDTLAGHKPSGVQWHTFATITLRTLRWGAKKPQSQIKVVTMHQLRLRGGWRYRNILGVTCQQCKFRYTGCGGERSVAELQMVAKVAADHIGQCYRNR